MSFQDRLAAEQAARETREKQQTEEAAERRRAAALAHVRHRAEVDETVPVLLEGLDEFNSLIPMPPGQLSPPDDRHRVDRYHAKAPSAYRRARDSRSPWPYPVWLTGDGVLATTEPRREFKERDRREFKRLKKEWDARLFWGWSVDGDIDLGMSRDDVARTLRTFLPDLQVPFDGPPHVRVEMDQPPFLTGHRRVLGRPLSDYVAQAEWPFEQRAWFDGWEQKQPYVSSSLAAVHEWIEWLTWFVLRQRRGRP